jgi:ABC-2 type transport system permease protein
VTVHALTRITKSEWKLLLREPAAIFFLLTFPPLLMIVLGSVPSFREPSDDFGGQRVIDLYTPVIITMSIALLSLQGLPQSFASYREQGVLRRMATTPVKPVVMLGGQLIMFTLVSVAVMVLVVSIGALAFGVAVPRLIPAYLLAYVLCVVSMLGIGLLVAAVARGGKAAGAIGSVLFFPVLFFAGLWLPREGMPEVLRRISDLTPLGAGVQSLSDAAAGHWPQLVHVVVMLVWTVGAGAVAARYFRWE